VQPISSTLWAQALKGYAVNNPNLRNLLSLHITRRQVSDPIVSRLAIWVFERDTYYVFIAVEHPPPKLPARLRLSVHNR
jgi:hypothetical protein